MENTDSMEVLKYITKDIIASFQYIPYGALAGAIALALLFLLVKKENRHTSSMIASAIFAMYAVVLLYLTLLSRESGSRDAVNLTIFGTWGASPQAQAFVIENLMLFVPIGILLPCLWKKLRIGGWCILAGFAISLFIEVTQLITGRGYFQVDDLLTNTLGAAVGYGIYKLASLLYCRLL